MVSFARFFYVWLLNTAVIISRLIIIIIFFGVLFVFLSLLLLTVTYGASLRFSGQTFRPQAKEGSVAFKTLAIKPSWLMETDDDDSSYYTASFRKAQSEVVEEEPEVTLLLREKRKLCKSVKVCKSVDMYVSGLGLYNTCTARNALKELDNPTLWALKYGWQQWKDCRYTHKIYGCIYNVQTSRCSYVWINERILWQAQKATCIERWRVHGPLYHR